MKLREATKEDLEYMVVNSTNTRVDRSPIENVCHVFTLEDNGVPIMVGGFQFITPTVAWCWVDTGKEFKKNRILAYRTIKEWIDLFVKNNGIKRLQSFIRCDFPEAIRMMEHLNFERESIMKRFLNNDDAYMYRRIYGTN